jgi:hypothetical protein
MEEFRGICDGDVYKLLVCKADVSSIGKKCGILFKVLLSLIAYF